MLYESFKINIYNSIMSRFKPKMALKYKNTYNEIIENILIGKLIHIDETKVSIQGYPCYVWIFCNMDSVYYLYKPTREADFLKEILNKFKGILISDFYTGYDSIKCHQQKCLIHLIRDLNDDLFKNQLNTEYKNIVLDFGVVIKKIIDTINKFGLKKYYLKKHKNDVKKFYNKIEKIDYETEISIKYQKRFIKYKDKLFTFLDYDGIPWNNNNAEHAIKHFAVYRKKANGIFSEKGISDYLILLSIYQTCRYRKISFLDFLKSGEKNIEKYSKKIN